MQKLNSGLTDQHISHKLAFLSVLDFQLDILIRNIHIHYLKITLPDMLFPAWKM